MDVDIIKKRVANIQGPRPSLFKFLIEIGAKVICEVGVASGKNLRKLSKCNPDIVVGIDPWDTSEVDFFDYPKEKTEAWYKTNIEWAKKQSFEVQIIRKFSLDAVGIFNDEFFDFVYIDADHIYDSVKADLKAWWPKVKKPGILAGHDYRMNWISRKTRKPYGIYTAVNDFVDKRKIRHNLYVTKHHIPSFLIVKE